MYTILGSSGVIGKELAKALPQYTNKIGLVSRNPKKVNEGDELFSANLLNAENTLNAVEGSEVVYLTVGLQYDIKIWRTRWPELMKNVIEACKKNNSKLVFFDNVYSYGRVNGWMTEETPVKPDSEKGKVRAELNKMIMNEVEQGNLKAIIAKAADFYGPDTPLSFVNIMVFENFKKGKKAQWFININKKHSFTYTPDAGKGTATLGNTESAYNQIWHLPTNKNVLTGKDFIELAANAMNVKPEYMIVKKNGWPRRWVCLLKKLKKALRCFIRMILIIFSTARNLKKHLTLYRSATKKGLSIQLNQSLNNLEDNYFDVVVKNDSQISQSFFSSSGFLN
jgi:nucleoside-diphosphate-sugar epimerase